jgi:flagellar L-ring protein FlgH
MNCRELRLACSGTAILFLGFFFTGCMSSETNRQLRIPAEEYASRFTAQNASGGAALVAAAGFTGSRIADRASMAEPVTRYQAEPSQFGNTEDEQSDSLNSQDIFRSDSQPDYVAQRSSMPFARPYAGPLAMGDPGVTSSLWREGGQFASLTNDHRARQAYDLITIIVSESSEGAKEADTDAERSSSILAGITNLFNFENDAISKNPGLNTSSLVNAQFNSTFEGEGETTRKGSLSARISAMVVEVLPSGVMRIEGEKIIAVNSEEQIMVISGLVRPRDVNSNNEVVSAKIANLRVDYYGKGVIGDVQYMGWLGRLLNQIWPF